jgi:hypothetical protein
MPQCSEWRDFAFLLPSEPGAKARDAMPPHDLHAAKPSSALPNGSWKLADGVAPCDKLSLHRDVFSQKSFLWQVAAAAHLLVEPSKARWQWPALRSARHVYLYECGAFLHAQILRLESMRICPAACHGGPVRESVFVAYFFSSLLTVQLYSFQNGGPASMGSIPWPSPESTRLTPSVVEVVREETRHAFGDSLLEVAGAKLQAANR